MNPKGSWPKNAKDPWPKNAKGPWPNNLVRKKALEQQIWNEIESSHFAFPLHTQPGCYITVPSCSARVTLKEHTPRAISMFDFSSRILVNSWSRKPCETRVGNAPWKPRRGDCPLKNQTKSISAILIGIKQNENKHIKEKNLQFNHIEHERRGLS